MATILFAAYDKTGLEWYADTFRDWIWDILASAGTAKYLREYGHTVKDVGEIVGPPILGHRVVTLSREIHAGLLAQNTPEDRAELERLNIPFIDAVYVTLYPLEEELAKESATLESIIEKTDIGGPTLLRAAAKGRRLVASGEEELMAICAHLKAHQGEPEDDPELRRWLAMRAELRATQYSLASAIAQCSDKRTRDLLLYTYKVLTGYQLEINCNI